VTFKPSKCKVMTISRKRIPTRPELQIGSTPLAVMNEREILGVTIDRKLTWTKHVSSTASRAGQKLGALRRVANKLDRRGRAIVYKAQVRSVMEYTSLSWMSASPRTLGLLDSIRKMSLRVIGVDVDEARIELNISSLHQRRQVAAVGFLYKMHTSKCPTDHRALLAQPYVVTRPTHSSMSMPSHAFAVPVYRTVSISQTFIHTAVQVWNSFPDKVMLATSLESFKSRVHEHSLSSV